ncbi:hypothetical protein FM107_20675 [Sphingobacterium sp. JB170]|nr:hypothetical protein FM107_20675 [Sphingobacterium sp. JB170]
MPSLAKKLNAALLFGSANAWTNRFAIVQDKSNSKTSF